MNQDRQKEQLNYLPSDDYSVQNESPIVLAERRAAFRGAEIIRNISELADQLKPVQEEALVIDSTESGGKDSFTKDSGGTKTAMIRGSTEDSRTWLEISQYRLSKLPQAA